MMKFFIGIILLIAAVTAADLDPKKCLMAPAFNMRSVADHDLKMDHKNICPDMEKSCCHDEDFMNAQTAMKLSNKKLEDFVKSEVALNKWVIKFVSDFDSTKTKCESEKKSDDDKKKSDDDDDDKKDDKKAADDVKCEKETTKVCKSNCKCKNACAAQNKKPEARKLAVEPKKSGLDTCNESCDKLYKCEKSEKKDDDKKDDKKDGKGKRVLQATKKSDDKKKADTGDKKKTDTGDKKSDDGDEDDDDDDKKTDKKDDKPKRNCETEKTAVKKIVKMGAEIKEGMKTYNKNLKKCWLEVSKYRGKMVCAACNSKMQKSIMSNPANAKQVVAAVDQKEGAALLDACLEKEKFHMTKMGALAQLTNNYMGMVEGGKTGYGDNLSKNFLNSISMCNKKTKDQLKCDKESTPVCKSNCKCKNSCKAQDKKPEAKKSDDKKRILQAKKTDDKKDDKKDDDKKDDKKSTLETCNASCDKFYKCEKKRVLQQAKKADAKKTDVKKTDDKKDDKKTEDKKTEDKKTEDKKTEEKKTEDKKTDDKKSDDKKDEKKSDDDDDDDSDDKRAVSLYNTDSPKCISGMAKYTSRIFNLNFVEDHKISMVMWSQAAKKLGKKQALTDLYKIYPTQLTKAAEEVKKIVDEVKDLFKGKGRKLAAEKTDAKKTEDKKTDDKKEDDDDDDDEDDKKDEKKTEKKDEKKVVVPKKAYKLSEPKAKGVWMVGKISSATALPYLDVTSIKSGLPVAKFQKIAGLLSVTFGLIATFFIAFIN